MRTSFPYRKKDSQNTQSTSFYSDKQHNKVLSAQKTSAKDLTLFLYSHGQAETRPKSTSFIRALNDSSTLNPKAFDQRMAEDPFIRAKLKFLQNEASKHVIPKKVGILYDELNMESFEGEATTTLKKQNEKQNRERVSSIRSILSQRKK